MTGEWRNTTLNQLGRIVTGKTPLSSREDCFGGDIPFVTPTDFDERRTIDSTGRYLTGDGADSVGASRIPRRAVMVSCIGSDMGKTAVAGRDCVTNQQINSIIVAGADDPLFVYYNLSNRKAEIRTAAGGSAQPILNKSAFGQLDILLPPPDEQRAIAHILGTLDDKIELNRRMNETLEAMARALFQSWFVAFDPVRAKQNANRRGGFETRPYLGIPTPFHNLFPNSFVDSELGEIPKGWGIGTLADLAELNPETWTKSTAPDEIEYVDLANTKWGKIEETQKYLWTDAPSRAQRILQPGDTIVGTVRPGNGSFAFIAQEGLTGSTGFAVLRPRKASYEEYTYLAATSSDNIDRLSHLADGAAYPAVRPDVVLMTRVILPEDLMLERFASIAKPIMAKIASSERESRTLAALRDTLLPKLIAGELRVQDAVGAKHSPGGIPKSGFGQHPGMLRPYKRRV